VAAAVVVAPPVATAAAEVKPRTVKVVILPAEATVDVDGIPATPNDGAIEITGPLASVHKVHVRSGDGEILRDVVVTEGGAIPPKVELAAVSPVVKPAVVGGKLPAVRTAAPAGGGPLPLRTQR
jgi:eukaryotic-like serine/threonine-protein kinase